MTSYDIVYQIWVFMCEMFLHVTAIMFLVISLCMNPDHKINNLLSLSVHFTPADNNTHQVRLYCDLLLPKNSTNFLDLSEFAVNWCVTHVGKTKDYIVCIVLDNLTQLVCCELKKNSNQYLKKSNCTHSVQCTCRLNSPIGKVNWFTRFEHACVWPWRWRSFQGAWVFSSIFLPSTSLMMTLWSRVRRIRTKLVAGSL